MTDDRHGGVGWSVTDMVLVSDRHGVGQTWCWSVTDDRRGGVGQ